MKLKKEIIKNKRTVISVRFAFTGCFLAFTIVLSYIECFRYQLIQCLFGKRFTFFLDFISYNAQHGIRIKQKSFNTCISLLQLTPANFIAKCCRCTQKFSFRASAVSSDSLLIGSIARLIIVASCLKISCIIGIIEYYPYDSM